GADTIYVNWGSTGSGLITVAEVNGSGCSSDTTLFPVTINLQPVATAAPDSATICQGNSLPITGTANTINIQWLTSGTGTFDDTTVASPVYTPGVTYSGYTVLKMIVSNPPCADDTAFVIVYVSPMPVLTVMALHDTICGGDVDTLVASGSGSFSWTSLPDTTDTVYVTPVISTTYVVTLTNGSGCSVSDSVFVFVQPPTGASVAPDSVSVCNNNAYPVNG